MTPPATRIYIDSSILIYALEASPQFGPASAALLAEIEAGRFAAETSELTIAEVLTLPLKRGRRDLVERFLDVLGAGSSIALFPVSRAVLLRAAELRASLGGRLADMIHAATADLAGCAVFVTEDVSLRVPKPIVRSSAARVADAVEARR